MTTRITLSNESYEYVVAFPPKSVEEITLPYSSKAVVAVRPAALVTSVMSPATLYSRTNNDLSS